MTDQSDKSIEDLVYDDLIRNCDNIGEVEYLVLAELNMFSEKTKNNWGRN